MTQMDVLRPLGRVLTPFRNSRRHFERARAWRTTRAGQGARQIRRLQPRRTLPVRHQRVGIAERDAGGFAGCHPLVAHSVRRTSDLPYGVSHNLPVGGQFHTGSAVWQRDQAHAVIRPQLIKVLADRPHRAAPLAGANLFHVHGEDDRPPRGRLPVARRRRERS